MIHQHIQHTRDELKLLNEKIHRMREQHTLETDAAIKFKVEKNIEAEEQERVRLEHIIAELEDKQERLAVHFDPAPKPPTTQAELMAEVSALYRMLNCTVDDR